MVWFGSVHTSVHTVGSNVAVDVGGGVEVGVNVGGAVAVRVRVAVAAAVALDSGVAVAAAAVLVGVGSTTPSELHRKPRPSLVPMKTSDDVATMPFARIGQDAHRVPGAGSAPAYSVKTTPDPANGAMVVPLMR